MSAGKRQVVSVAERVLDADPTRVWALIADPERVGEWAGVTMVGYMGTGLPKTGQSVFVRSKRWGRLTKTRRIEIEGWDAGAGVRCRIHSAGGGAGMRFDMAIKPQVTNDGIATKVRLEHRMDARVTVSAFARRWTEVQLNRRSTGLRR